MCANPHLLKVVQYKTVVGTVHFLVVDPLIEEGSKLLLQCYPATIVLGVEGLSYIIAQREDDGSEVGKEIVAQA
jgi:hypothetical protein